LCAINEEGLRNPELTILYMHACDILVFRATPQLDSVHVISPHPFKLKGEGTDIVNNIFYRKTAGVSGPVEGPDQGPAKSLQVEK
jgi:hypothetical protein